MNLEQTLLQSVGEAHKGALNRKMIYQDPQAKGKNEFLFFIKPELTWDTPDIRHDLIFKMILEKLSTYGMQIKNALLLPSSYLKEYDIIASHYGVINAIARNAAKNLNAGARKAFADIYGKELRDLPVMGGLEFAAAYPELSPEAIDYLWQNAPVKKLGGGAYCGEIRIDGQPVYLVNGFHPRQLEHFIQDGRFIIAMTLCGNTSWKDARNKLIGKTNPADAEPGSIRRTLLDSRDEFGLAAVSSSWNGVHLSAGPVEGLVELIRYNSDFSSSSKLKPSDFSFGQALLKEFQPATVERILENPEVVYENNTVSVFDLTEEKDADEALPILRATKIN